MDVLLIKTVRSASASCAEAFCSWIRPQRAPKNHPTYQSRAVSRGMGRMLLLFHSRQGHSSGPYRPRIASAGNSTTTQRSFNLTLASSELLFGQQSSVRNLLIFGYRKSIPSSRELVQTSSMCVSSGDFREAHPYLEAHIDGRSAAKASRAGTFIDDQKCSVEKVWRNCFASQVVTETGTYHWWQCPGSSDGTSCDP